MIISDYIKIEEAWYICPVCGNEFHKTAAAMMYDCRCDTCNCGARIVIVFKPEACAVCDCKMDCLGAIPVYRPKKIYDWSINGSKVLQVIKEDLT